MKRSILMFMVIAVALVFFGCEKEDILPPNIEQEELEESALKCAKVKRTFEGICTKAENPDPQVNEWYDATDDWRTTGATIWVIDGTNPEGTFLWGTAELIVDPKNPHDESRGKWEITYEATWISKPEPEVGFDIVCWAEGKGVEGKVKGLKANWLYTMDFDGTPETFFYVIEGNIEKPKGPIKK